MWCYRDCKHFLRWHMGVLQSYKKWHMLTFLKKCLLGHRISKILTSVLCFQGVCACIHAYVPNKHLACWQNLFKLSPLMDVGTRMNALNLGFARVKVIVGSIMPQDALFGLVVVTWLVAWHCGNALHLINEVTLCQPGHVSTWMGVWPYGQVNHLSM